MFRSDGRWVAHLYVIDQPDLVTFFCNSRGFKMACLQDDVAQWLDANDPQHVAIGVRDLLVLRFECDNAAMLFRMKYDAWVAYG